MPQNLGICLIGIALLLGACTTYQETKQKLATGYYSDLQLQADREQQLAQDDQIQLNRDLSTLQQRQLADLQKKKAALQQAIKALGTTS